MRSFHEYLRVPFANFTSFVIPESCELEDEFLLFLSDVLPTAYWSVINAGVKPGDCGRFRLGSHRVDGAKIRLAGRSQTRYCR